MHVTKVTAILLIITASTASAVECPPGSYGTLYEGNPAANMALAPSSELRERGINLYTFPFMGTKTLICRDRGRVVLQRPLAASTVRCMQSRDRFACE